MVAAITTTYTLLYCGRLNNLTENPSIPAPTNLLEFLQPLPAAPGHKGMHEVEPISEPTGLSEYIPLPDLLAMSPNLPPPEPTVSKVPIINISSLNPLAPTMVHHQLPNSTVSDPSEELSTTASRVFRHSSGAYVLLVCIGSTPRSFPVGVVIKGMVFELQFSSLSRIVVYFRYSIIARVSYRMTV